MGTSARRAIVMVWDGLRPDYVTPELTPRLHALAADGVRFADSHAAYPTVTRANAAALATGTHPARHGIPGNNFVTPLVEPGRVFSSANHEHLAALGRARGRVLLAETLCDSLTAAGRMTAVVGTGSAGSALLHHPEVVRHGHLLLHPLLWSGVDPDELATRYGPLPDMSRPNTGQTGYFTTLITDHVLPRHDPVLTVLWHTDPDSISHVAGVGHPDTLRGIGDADANLGRILDALDRLGTRDETDVVIVSDHGFSTVVGPLPISDALVAAGVKRGTDSDDVVVGTSDGSVYVRDRDPDVTRRVAEILAGLDQVGAVFVRSDDGPVPAGTWDLASIGHGGDLGADLLVSGTWNDDPNEHGYPGMVRAGNGKYPATHGSASPWDIRNTLIAAGPSFRRGVVSEVPAGNIDVAPTLRHTLGLPPVETDGRVLVEALRDGPDPASVTVERRVEETADLDGRVVRRIQRSHVDGGSGGSTSYLDWAGSVRA